MNHRRYFSSSYEQYDPAQNMHMLANHAFKLSEGILKLNDDFAESHRMLGFAWLHRILDFVATNRCDVDASVRAVGTDFGDLREDINVLQTEVHSVRTEVHSVCQETQQGIQELKQLAMIAVRGQPAHIRPVATQTGWGQRRPMILQ